LEENVEYNAAQDESCLREVQDLINYYRDEKKKPVAGIIIEPIQSEGGDNHASAHFFQSLQKMADQVNIIFLFEFLNFSFVIIQFEVIFKYQHKEQLSKIKLSQNECNND